MSKLDEAFLKAYAKVRENGREKANPPSHSAKPQHVEPQGVHQHHLDPQNPTQPPLDQFHDGREWDTSTFSAADLVATQATDEQQILQLLRLEDGAVDVAAFIARTSDGRTRGTAPRPPGGVADRTDPQAKPSPETLDKPAFDVSGDQILDSAHSLQGPHFQPISLDLAALDVFAPAAAVVAEKPAGRRIVNANNSVATTTEDVGSAVASLSLDTASGCESFPQADLVTETESTSLPLRQSRVHEPLDKPATSGQERSTPAGDREGVFVRTDDAHQVEVIDEAATLTTELPEIGQPGLASGSSTAGEGVANVVVAEHCDSHSEFCAAWEVDRLEFEDIIWDLSAERSPLWAAVEQLEIACREGLKVLAITSPGRGQGRSTLSITLARMLSATGLNVALLDGDIDRPALADKLRLEIRLGWGDAVSSGLSVEEVAVQSVEDGFTVLPSAVPDSAKGTRPDVESISAMMNQLRNAFDLVVIDTANVNVIGGWIPGAEDGHIDAALVIQDTRIDDSDAMQACLRRLQKIGIDNIGLVENFSNT